MKDKTSLNKYGKGLYDELLMIFLPSYNEIVNYKTGMENVTIKGKNRLRDFSVILQRKLLQHP